MRWKLMVRCSPKNMCSVRHSPMPSAPSARASVESSGVSEFARTPMTRTSSAHDIIRANSPYSSESSAFMSPLSTAMMSLSAVSTSPSMTSPVAPSIEMYSPSFTVWPLTWKLVPEASRSMAEQPTTHGLPIWRPTTAAWEVFPPNWVRIPWAAAMPLMSSGVVSGRTRTTRSPCSAAATASSAVKTALPAAAPGEAATPTATASGFFSRSNCGWSS